MLPVDLINYLVEYVAEHGNNKPVVIDLLTENQSNYKEISGTMVDRNGVFSIISDVNDKREFKKSIK